VLNIDIGIALPLPYVSDFVTLSPQEHAVAFELVDGTHVAQSTALDLGVVHGFQGRRLLGRFTFEYTYDSERRTITVPGTDYDSAGGMCLVTMPENSDETCRQYGAGGGFRADELTSNTHWNYTTPLTPGLRDVFIALVRTASDRVIAQLKERDGLIVQVRKHVPELPPELHQQFMTVYRDGVFQGFHEPGRQYGPGDEVLTIESVFGGEVTFNYQEAFANVIGSTPDPHIGGLSWVQLWANQFNTWPVVCTSYQSFGFNCGNTFVGGHVVTGTVAKSMPAGSNSVYIFPICHAHNNNDGVYMLALKYLQGIWLKNYLGH